MKANIFVAALLLLCLGCTSQQSDRLTQQQKDQIKSEVKAVFDSVFAKGEMLDADGALQYYSPELVAVDNSSLIDYPAYKKKWIDFNNSAATVKWTTVRWEFIVLTKDLVISAWVGKMVFLLKSGDKTTIDPQGYTDVCRKVGGHWKVIYEHASGIPVTQKAGNK
jgi:hypothetical protein